jgi:hypothetical protein
MFTRDEPLYPPPKRDYKKSALQDGTHRVSTNVEDRRPTQIFEDDPFNPEDYALTQMSIGNSMRSVYNTSPRKPSKRNYANRPGK